MNFFLNFRVSPFFVVPRVKFPPDFGKHTVYFSGKILYNLKCLSQNPSRNGELLFAGMAGGKFVTMAAT